MWTRRIHLANTLIICVVAILMAMVVQRFYAQQQSTFHVIAGINLYEIPIKVLVEDSVYEVEPFGIYHHFTKASFDQTITVTNTKGELLSARNKFIGTQPTLAFDMWGTHESIASCAVLADVTDLYYAQSDATRTFQYRVLSATPTTSIGYAIEGESANLVVPGQRLGVALPLHKSNDTRIRGVYPMPCDDIDNADRIGDWITWWHNYDAKKQQRLLAKVRTDIENNPTYLYPPR